MQQIQPNDDDDDEKDGKKTLPLIPPLGMLTLIDLQYYLQDP